MDLLEQVERAIKQRGLLARGQGLLVAVSGGLDSMVLLHLLSRLAARWRWRLSVAHLNHQLRGRSSQADERLVRHTAAHLGLPVVVERAEVRALAAAQGLSLEMAARDLRHAFLARAALSLRLRRVVLAHHADDQVELFFLRLLRGSGLEGLAGMHWSNPSPLEPKVQLVRPLLEQSKAALLDYARSFKVPFREDASNGCLDMQRNRLRHQLLPLLRRDYQPGLQRVILRLMELAGAESEFVGAAASHLLGQGLEGPFEALPLALQRRCLRLQLLQQGVNADFELVERLRLEPNKTVSLGGATPPGRGAQGACAAAWAPLQYLAKRDESGLLHIQAAQVPGFQSEQVSLDLSRGSGQVVFGDTRLCWRVMKGRPKGLKPGQSGCEWFDAERVGSPIVLRHWQPGDRFQPIGTAQAVKLQDLFVNAKVPRQQRHTRIVAVGQSGELFWVENLRIAERFKLLPRTIRSLHWAWHRL